MMFSNAWLKNPLTDPNFAYAEFADPNDIVNLTDFSVFSDFWGQTSQTE